MLSEDEDEADVSRGGHRSWAYGSTGSVSAKAMSEGPPPRRTWECGEGAKPGTWPAPAAPRVNAANGRRRTARRDMSHAIG